MWRAARAELADPAVTVNLSPTAVVPLTGTLACASEQVGPPVTLQVKTHDAVMQSTATGRGTPGRVRAVLYPNQPGGLGAAQTAAPASSPPPQ